MMGFRTPIWGAVWASACLLAGPSAASAATIAVPAGGDLQAALNAARPGDVITLAPGATYVGNFVLPNKGAATDFITIRSAAPDSALPPAGVRMTPAYAALLPKIRSSNSMSALRTATAANHWKLLFLEFQANVNGYGDIIALGAGDSTQTQLSQVPYALVVDRIYVHGDPALGQKRGISLHSSDTTVINSYISECKAIGQDSQAISGFNGPGNYLIENNYLEGATENFLLGGADPTIPDLVTTNVTFRRNHLRKPLAWRDPIMAMPAAPAARVVAGGGSLAAGTYYYRVAARAAAGQTNKATSAATAEVSAAIAAGTTGGITISWTPVAGAAEYLVYGRTTGGQAMYWKTANPYFTDTGAAGTSGTPSTSGTKWAVKNIFELKNAQDVLVEGNVFENLWVADQPGYPIVLTPRNQSGTAPWVVVQRVTFQYNLVRHTAGGVNILGVDNLAPTRRTNHIAVRHNVFEDLTSGTWGSGSRPFQMGDGPDFVTIDHNTVSTSDATILSLYGGSVTAPTPIPNFVYTNNMTPHNSYGIFGSGFSSGTSSINAYLPGAVVNRNVIAGGNASKYPTGNFFPTVPVWQSNLVSYGGGDFHFAPGYTAYRGVATDGGDLGADVDAINAHTAIALSGDDTIPPGNNGVRISTTSPLQNAVLHQAYAESLTCRGGSGPCAWQVRESSLPDGLAFDAVAAIVSGTPSAVQTGTLVVEAYDPSWPANSTVATLLLTVDPPPFVVTMPHAPATQVGASYEVTPSVSGVMGSATWSLASGSLPSGVDLDPSCGAIRGVPTAWGSFTALVQAQDSWGAGRVDAKPVTVTVAPAALSIDAPSLANAVYHVPYSGFLSATGGSGSTTWSVAAGALPEGVTVGANGSLSGTPTVVGTFTATVQARDANWPDNVAARAITVTVDAPDFSIAMPASPAATVGQPYHLTATASGNVGTVAWTIVAGALPSGVTLDAASGTIAGTPIVWGTFSVLVQAIDSWGAGRVDVKAVTMSVAPTALAITTDAVAAGMYQEAYQASLVATGGTGAATWSLTAGLLPSGTTLSGGGALTGTPTVPGTYAFTVQAQDANWPTNVATRALSLTVDAPIFRITVPPSPASMVGQAYAVTASAAGNVGIVAWTVGSGALPTGVTIDPATGVIAGVPTMFGSFTATVKAQDSWQASRVGVAPITITVAPTPLAISTAPLSSAAVRQAYQATLTATGGTGHTTWTVSAGSLPPGMTLAANGAINGTPTTAGTFTFTVRAADSGWAGNTATQGLTIAVTARETVLYASDATAIAGAWSLVADATAAGATRLANPDAAAAKLTTALAAPVSYFEMTFQAEAGVAYHLWMRGKADRNSWANDSVFVQFSGTVDANGAAVNRIGSTSATVLSVEEGMNAGLAGWGWADDLYGGFASPLYFGTSGLQTIRVQVREDGVSFDQIVLSADKYAVKAPGVTKNDTMILAK